MFSKAWMMRLRSKTAKIERPRPTRLGPLAVAAAPSRGFLQQLHRARVVEQDAPLDVAHDHALRELRHERGEPVLFLLEAGVGVVHPALDVLAERLVRVGETIDARGQLPDLGRADARRPMRRVRGQHDPGVLRQLPRRRHVAPKQRADEQQQRHEEQQRNDDDAGGMLAQRQEERRALLLGHVGARRGRRSRPSPRGRIPTPPAASAQPGFAPAPATPRASRRPSR